MQPPRSKKTIDTRKKWQFIFNPLAVVAFTSGFALMAFELVAARILAPSIGGSTYVWTSVIGVIMIALSLGYYIGGRLADKRSRELDVAILSFVAAALVVLVLFLYPPILQSIVDAGGDRRWQAFWAALVLFAPASVILGMISPYLTKLNITSLETSGQSVAALSVMNSIGSIAGTFIAGFILFNYIGSRETLVVVVVILVATAWCMAPRKFLGPKFIMTVVLLATAVLGLTVQTQRSFDTPTASYQIHDYIDNKGQTVRGIISGPGGIQSGVYLDQPDALAFWYTRQFQEIVAASPKKDRILMLGGGTYTVPRALASDYPDAQIDVVEIDPGLTQIARDYFSYNDPKNVTIYDDDARAFLNAASSDQYDVILIDAYSDASIPFSLMTREYGEQMARLLKDGGVVAVNAIAAPTGSCAPLHDAIDAAHAPVSTVYYERQSTPGALRSNMMLVYTDQELDLAEYTKKHTRALVMYTDNFMPADALQQQCIAVSDHS